MNPTRVAIVFVFVVAVAISEGLQYWIKSDYFYSFIAGLVFSISVFSASLSHFKPALAKTLGGRIVASIAAGFIVVELYETVTGVVHVLLSHTPPGWFEGFLDGTISAAILGFGLPAAALLFDKALLEDSEPAVSLGH